MKLAVVNPATGKVAARLPADDAPSIRAKYERARSVRPAWSRVRLKGAAHGDRAVPCPRGGGGRIARAHLHHRGRQADRAIARLAYASGIPRDAFIPVIGAGEAGAALVAQPVDGVFFTGSVANGRRIAEALRSCMIKLQLELGGKDPVCVCDDVDVASAAARWLVERTTTKSCKHHAG